MSQFWFSVGLCGLLFAGLARGAEINAVSARVRISGPVNYNCGPAFRERCNGGLVYGAETGAHGSLELLGPDGYVVSSYSILLRMRSLGATALLGQLMDRNISLGNVNGKTVRKLHGTYYGLRAGIAIALQGQASVAMNRHGVLMGNLAGGVGFGVDVAIPAITIYANGHSGLDDVIRIRRY